MKGLRIALAVAVLLSAYALGGASAKAASIGPQPFAAARIATARDASAVAPSVVLAGFTSQDYPTFFKVSGNARTLTLAGIALNMTCTSGAEFVLADLFAHVRINPNGRLRSTASQPPTAGPNGGTVTSTDSLTGRLNRRHSQLSGLWRLQVNYSFTNGMSDQCDSGPVRFLATG
jgi:hypothetical protein